MDRLDTVESIIGTSEEAGDKTLIKRVETLEDLVGSGDSEGEDDNLTKRIEDLEDESNTFH